MLDLFFGSHHILYFNTNDMEKTINFYRDFLGWPIYLSLEIPEKNQKLYIFSVSKDFSIGFYEWKSFFPLPAKSPGAPVSGNWSFDHLMIGVETEEDLWLLKDKCLMSGIDVTDPVDHGFVYSIYFFDPNNISLEFSYQTYNIRGLSMFLDPSPSSIAQEGAFPKESYWKEKYQKNHFDKKVLPRNFVKTFPESLKLKTQEELNKDFTLHPYNSYYSQVKRDELFYSYQGSHILFFTTSNMDETIRFYRDLLGFQMNYSAGGPYNSFKMYMFNIDDLHSLAFFYWPTVKPPARKVGGEPTYWWRWNYDSFSIGLSSVSKLWLLYEQLVNVGYSVSEVFDNGYSYSFEVFDPNNNCISFHAFTIDLSKEPLLLDKNPPPNGNSAFPQKGYWPDSLDPTPKGQRKVLPGVGWDLIPPEMKNAEIKVDLTSSFDEEE
ncbi:MAG: VOC family protein [Candidatus Thorarchaeota archaeon]